MASFIKVQRGTTTFGASADSTLVTIPEAVSSTAKAFVRITNACYVAGEPAAGDAAVDRNNDDIGMNCLLTSTTQFTLTRLSTGTNEDVLVYWEVWEYTGPAGGRHEFGVLYNADISMSGGTGTGNGSTVTATDRSKVVPFICGITNTVVTESWASGTARADIQNDGGGQDFHVRVLRGATSGTTLVSVAAVEFKGAAWIIQQNVNHAFTAAGTDETTAITDVVSWTRAFIVSSFTTTTSGNDEVSCTVRPGATTTAIRFRLRSGFTTPTGADSVAHVVRNDSMTVNHHDSITGALSDLTGGGGAPQTSNYSITSLNDTAHASAIVTTDNDSTAVNYASPMWNYRLTSAANLEMWRPNTVGGGDLVIQGIDFTQVGSIPLAASVQAVGTPTLIVKRILLASVVATGTATAPLRRVSFHLTRTAVGTPTRTFALTMAAMLRTATGTATAATSFLSGAVFLRVTRIAFEVIARAPSTIVEPQDDPLVMANFLMVNWQDPVQLDSVWQTDVAVAESLAEDRRSLVDRPTRSLTIPVTGLNQRDSLKSWMHAMRAATSRGIVPLYTDHSRVTAVSSGTTIWCDTRYRRFFIGARAVIHEWTEPNEEEGNRPTNVQHGIVAEIFTDRLVLTAALTGSYPIGARAYPGFDSEINRDAVLGFLSDEHSQYSANFVEVSGSSALPATADDEAPGYSTHEGAPILDLRPDWSSKMDASFSRAGETYGLGRGTVVETRGARPEAGHELRFTCLHRSVFWRLLQLFEYLRGRTRPLWIVAEESLFEAVAITTARIDIRPVGNFEDLDEFVSHVGIMLRDGTEYVRGVTATDMTTFWRLTFDTALPGPPDLDELRKVTTAHLSRMSADIMSETWFTDEQCEVRWEVVELINEEDVELDQVEVDFGTGTAPDEIDDLVLWVDASRNVFFDDAYAVGTAERSARTETYPSVGSKGNVWDDCRRTPSIPYLESIGANDHTLIVFGNENSARGRRALEHTHTGQSGFHFRNGNRPAWSNDLGFTVFIVLRTRVSLAAETLFRVRRKSDSALMFVWQTNRVQVYQTAGVTNSALWIDPLTSPQNGAIRILTFTWQPGIRTEAYYDGVLQGSAATPVSGMPLDDTEDDGDLFCFLTGGSASVLRDAGVGAKVFDHAALWYKRGLTDDELNQVGQHLASLYGTRWSDI